MVERGTLLKAVGVAVLLAGVAGGAYVYQLGSDFQQPQVQSVTNEFGTVTTETTVVESHIVVDNPNDQSIPGVATVAYEVRMNSVVMADGSQGGIGLQPGENRLNVTAELANERVPAWWVTHVNSGERTTLSIDPSLSVSALPIDTALPAQNSTITTDILGAFAREEPREVTVGDRPILTVSDQQARWGEATAEQSPIVVTNRIENTHDEPVRLDGTVYRIEMNGVVVGNGTTDASFELAPGETTDFTVRPTIETPRMQAWWVSHLQNDQRTRLSVTVYGLVERNGTTERTPLTVFRREAQIRSEFLGDGNVTVERLDAERDAVAFTEPTLTGTESEWGEVGEETTEIDTRIVVANPNEDGVGGLIRLRLDQRTGINGVAVADGETTTGSLDSGTNEFTLESEFRHSTVPAWWARHLNGGERSSVVTRTDAVADVGVTTLDVAVDDRERTLTTDLLAGFNDSTARPVEQEGRTVATIEATRATWGNATPAVAPIDSRVTVTNERARPITIEDITYTVSLNDVVLADNRTVDRSYEIAPLSTETIRPTFRLDNSRMEAWWPTHVRNGESSVMQTDVYLTVSSPLGDERVKLDSFSQNRTVDTEFF
ncbi:LEA type 2 family protein [Halorarius halobius]|uniref:LEA type 2 family protein n=1 Tax=Halorarius halobius TaxID=2962671 RepID=UPI0020CE06AA|nr:LEA type 2 family protein [Halorarius halobius]